jgi:hypothetical protein
MDDAKLKAILQTLTADVEYLAASQDTSIALLRKMSKGTLSAGDVRNAIQETLTSKKSHFDKLRKQIEELS